MALNLVLHRFYDLLLGLSNSDNVSWSKKLWLYPSQRLWIHVYCNSWNCNFSNYDNHLPDLLFLILKAPWSSGNSWLYGQISYGFRLYIRFHRKCLRHISSRICFHVTCYWYTHNQPCDVAIKFWSTRFFLDNCWNLCYSLFIRLLDYRKCKTKACFLYSNVHRSHCSCLGISLL